MHYTSKRGVNIMGGIVAIGAFGLTLVGIGLLEKLDININEGALYFTMEMVKFGGILYILKVAATTFL